MPGVRPITPCLWFADQAEEAVSFYRSVFKDSRLLQIVRYGEAGHEIHGMPAGSVMTIDFELNGVPFTALNGGPAFTFNESISLQVFCATQEETDYYWERLGEGGDPAAQQCGWLKDKYGLSWQIVPEAILPLLEDPNDKRSQRAMNAMLQMKKLDAEVLRRAYEG
jgi:predicted 3-demethylubiquinone-9 3-methyltransferase (glyoxalase superfamily)